MARRLLAPGVAIAFLLAPLSIWFMAVNNAVHGPYLDEEFHIRQAQHYCKNDFHIWDPKITTPPGLYLISYACSYVFGCGIPTLRAINAICLVALLLVLRATYSERRRLNTEDGFMSGVLATHSALNLVLFPPLFFFSALYYTDLPSTLSVMVFYHYFLKQATKQPTLRSAFTQVFLGAVSLTFRQTNIFWVAIWPAALKLVVYLDQGHRVAKISMYKRSQGFGDTMWSVCKTSWKMNVVYDPPVRDAFFEDYVRTFLSIVAGALKAATETARVFKILFALSPYITTLGLFAGFIVWNGSVVLGDKSNHVATIHLAQMLYLWPFVAFFSWPFLVGHFALFPLMSLARLSSLAGFEPLLNFRRRSFLPRHRLFFLFTILAAIIIQFNTVVHPFTLADNRHFNFYIFKRLLNPWWMRFIVAPVYVLTGWACIDARGEQPAAASNHIQTGNTSNTCKDDPIRSNLERNASASDRRISIPDGRSTPMVSFILIFLIVSSLALCTAPLVEPRYCIIPYMIWRMHLPLDVVDNATDRRIENSESISEILAGYDWRVILETVWMCVVNAVAGYIFLNWTFVWVSEPFRTQRFMW